MNKLIKTTLATVLLATSGMSSCYAASDGNILEFFRSLPESEQLKFLQSHAAELQHVQQSDQPDAIAQEDDAINSTVSENSEPHRDNSISNSDKIAENSETERDEIPLDSSQIQQNQPNLESDIQDVRAPEGIEKIVDNDDLNELQRVIREKGEQYYKKSIRMTFKGETCMDVPLIQYCVMKGAMNCFKFLLINGLGDPSQTMRCLTGYQGYIVTIPSTYEWDCLATAIYCGQIEMAKILEEFGFEKGSNSGHLEAAILSHRKGIAKEIIRNLKEKGAPNRQKILDAGLVAAAQSNNMKILKILINEGADINAKSRRNKTALIWAAKNNNKEIADILISNSANVNMKDNFSYPPTYQYDQCGLTPLHYAVKNNSKEMVALLISKGVNIDINAKCDNNGWRPLHIAAMQNSKEIVELLISKGAKINAKDAYGITPLRLVLQYNKQDMVDLLKQHGATE